MLEDRLLYELSLLDKFQKNNEFLKEYKIINDDPLKIEFELIVKEHVYAFTAAFNKYFPYQPIEIIATTKFFSVHQYKNGAMCLKYWQDNWDKNITFTKLLENLYELLFEENPLGIEHGKAPDGENLTLGQIIRGNEEPTIFIPTKLDFFDKKEGVLTYNIQKNTDICYVYSINDINF